MAGGESMNTNLISKQIEEYISYKRSIGYKIKIEADELRRFAKYTIDIGYKGSLKNDIVMKWAALKPHYSRWYMARRLETVRTFGKYICIFDPMAQMPPKGVFGRCHGRVNPYIYTEEEICILMNSALNLYSPDKLRGRTISTAIGLLWSTGMRPGEACNLHNDDVDLVKGLITINETKFSKSRILPLDKTTISKLKSYESFKNKIRKNFLDQHFLITTGSQKLKLRNFENAMQIIRKDILKEESESKRRLPRLYDIRHSFACHTLLKWLKNGINVDSKILYLSTYLGHVKVADTYWYLTGTPDLMNLVSKNFEKYFSKNGGRNEE